MSPLNRRSLGDPNAGGALEIESINHAISFLGTRGAAAREPISPIAHRPTAAEHNPSRPRETKEPAVTTHFSKEALERSNAFESSNGDKTSGLSEAERKEVDKLKQRDQEVRRHEQAHKAAAGQLASGGPSFAMTRGRDGKQYAVSGEVQIDISAVAGDPEATIRKMRQVQSAARAPANPSGADLKVASSAARQEAAARVELREAKATESRGDTNDETTTPVVGGSRSSQRAEGNSDRGPDHRPVSPLPEAYRAGEPDRSGALLDLLA